MNSIIIWMLIAGCNAIFFFAAMIGIIIVQKKTHAFIELKASFKGTPIGLFFQDNRYCEWKNTAPDAGLITDKQYGCFVIESTYVDNKTKNVLIPFNTSFAMSLNVKGAKMADDLSYVFKEPVHRRTLKNSIINGTLPETKGISTLRTSVNFSAIKQYVSPLLPHNIQSKIVNTVQLRIKQYGSGQFQNIIIIAISAIGAMILGGLVLKFVI